MKKVLVTLIIGLSIVAVSSNFIGSKTESHIQSTITKINENPYLRIAIVEYNKGWFTSEVEYSIKITPLNALTPSKKTNEIPELKINQTLFHGPFLWKADTLGLGLMDAVSSIELPEDMRIQLEKLASINTDDFQLRSRTQFNGSTTTYFNSPNIDINQDNTTINIKPSEFEFYSGDSGKILSHFTWQGIEISTSNVSSFSIGKTTMTIDQQMIRGEFFSPSAIATGSFETLFENIRISPSSAPAAIELSSVLMKAESSVNENLIDVNFIFSIANIEAMNMAFTDFIFDYSLLNLDIDALQQLNNSLTNIQNNKPQKPELLLSKIKDSFLQIIPLFLESNPIVKINQFGLTSEAGTVDTRLELFINNKFYDKDDINSIASALEVHASGEAPVAFFDQFGLGPVINVYVDQKMLIKVGSELQFKADYMDQDLVINNVSIPLPKSTAPAKSAPISPNGG